MCGYTAAVLPTQAPAVAQVFHTVLAHGPLSRAEVTRRTGLSPGAVTKASAPLLEDDWIEEVGPPPGTGSPDARRLCCRCVPRARASSG